MKRRLAIGISLVAIGAYVATAAYGLHRQDRPPATSGESIDANGVTVSSWYTPGANGTGSISVTFAADKPGYHFYSLGMPDDGVQGIGRPIRIAISGSLEATGAPRANKPVTTITPAGLDVALPVYPDGPVTVDIPVRSVAGTDAKLVVGYAACSATTCLVPVSGQVLDMQTAFTTAPTTP